MALVPLNIAPSLRPWRYAGVSRLLLDAETAASLRAESVSPPEERQARPPLPQQRQDAQAHMPPAPPDTGRRNAAQQPAPPPRWAESARQTHVSVSGQAAPQAASQATSQAADGKSGSENGVGGCPVALLPPSRWAPFWQDLLQRTPPRPSLLWTYPGLGRDLSGQADAAHRDFLRRLLGDMALPKGSHAFWPLNSWPPAPGAPAAGEEAIDTVDAAHFLSGVARLNPGTVLLMTGTPPEGLGLSHLRPLSPAIVSGRRFVVTQHVESLIGEPGRYAQLMTFLKALLIH